MLNLPNFSQIHKNYLFKQGKIPYIQYLIESYPKEYRPALRDYISDLDSTEVAKNPQIWFQKAAKFNDFLVKNKHLVPDMNNPIHDLQASGNQKSFIIRGSADLFGYRPAGSKLWNYFANPFGVFGYVFEQYWAARKSVDLLREAIIADGFWLEGLKGVGKRQLLQVYKVMKDLDVRNIAVEIAAQHQAYGNVWMLPHHNRLGGIKKLELLFPGRILPVFDRTTEAVVEWEYIIGRLRLIYAKDELKHLMCPSLQSNQIGSPPLVSAITEIETALAAINLNNNIFQKGGLVGAIIALKTPTDDQALSTSTNSNWVREIQAQFDYLYSGSKAGQGIVAMNNVEGVHQITDIGKIDANWQAGREWTAKLTCQLMGVPSEKAGIPRNANAQYVPEFVEQVVNAQFNDTVNRLETRVYDFLNTYVLEEGLGIDNIKIRPIGRYGSSTPGAADVILKISQSGLAPSVNELRTKVLGWNPLPPDDPRGNKVVDISINRDIESIPALLAPEQQDPDLEISTLSKIDKIDGEVLKLKVGGLYDGQFYTNYKETRS
jgi:hypothetical protein